MTEPATMQRFAVKVRTIAASLLATLVFQVAGVHAEEGNALSVANVNLSNVASLQRGARLYFNYCSGCHSIKYMSYSRIGQDLGLSNDEVLKNFAFTGAKIGDQIKANLTEESAQQFFGKMPPDLSLEARSKGSNWIYSYLKAFYLDPSRPVGWNNRVFPNAAMPNVLWELQGQQKAEYAAAKPGEEAQVEKLDLAIKGRQDEREFDQTARDITAFLQYVGEPSAIKREATGVWVVLYLALFTFIAWMLKHEFWKDVH